MFASFQFLYFIEIHEVQSLTGIEVYYFVSAHMLRLCLLHTFA